MKWILNELNSNINNFLGRKSQASKTKKKEIRDLAQGKKNLYQWGVLAYQALGCICTFMYSGFHCPLPVGPGEPSSAAYCLSL